MTEADLLLRATGGAEGNLALHTAPDASTVRAVLENRTRLLAGMGFSLDDLVVGEQVHGTRIREVSGADRGRGAREATDAFPETDGLLTRERGVVLMLLGADCPLVALHDPTGPGLVVAHAGWRGLAGGILERAMTALAPADPEGVRAYLAPCAGPCCYEVGEEVAERFPEEAVRRKGGAKANLDLPKAVELALGRPVTRLAKACTICDEAYFSHRRTGTHERQALIASLGPRNP